MGDRASIVLWAGADVSPACYLHWGGQQVGQLLAELRKLMVGREIDVAYAFARLCGLAHNATPGNMSLAIDQLDYDQARSPAEQREAWKTSSPGDFGIVLVQLDNLESREGSTVPWAGSSDDPLVDSRARRNMSVVWRAEVFGGYGFQADISGMRRATVFQAFFGPPT